MISLDKKTVSIVVAIITVIGVFSGNHIYINGFSDGGPSSNGKGILIDAAINQHKIEETPHLENKIIDEQLKDDVKQIYGMLDLMQSDIIDIKIAICGHPEFHCNTLN